MNELAWHDLAWSLQRCPKRVLEEMKASGPKVFVAGGFIRSIIAQEPINDVDMFTSSKTDAQALAFRLSQREPGAKNTPQIHETDNAYTLTDFKPTVQIIHRWNFDSPALCVESFDFTIAKAAFWWDSGWKSYVDIRFYKDLAGKRLIYTAPVRDEEPGGSMLRVLKFYQKGYRIPLDSLGAVVARLVGKVEMDKIKGTGPEKEYQLKRVLTALLLEVDPSVDPDHIAHLPSAPDAN